MAAELRRAILVDGLVLTRSSGIYERFEDDFIYTLCFCFDQ